MNKTNEHDEHFARMIQLYADMVLRLALSQVGSLADAQDVCQDVFIKVYRHRLAFRDQEHEKAWIIRVTLNRCRDLFRSSWKKWFRPYSDIPEQHATENRLEILPIDMTLPRKYRTVIHLYYYEGYSASEIAGLLGIRDGTVRTQLRRARELLKDRMGGYDDDDESEVRERNEPNPGEQRTEAGAP